MIIATLPGVGNLRDLTVDHLDGWNTIAADPDVHKWLNLQSRTKADPAKSLADLPAQVCAGADETAWCDAVLVGKDDEVLAAVELKVYRCSGDHYGLMVDYAVAPNHRGRRLAAQLTSKVSEWITTEVPGTHVFIEVCSKNAASIATARILSMAEVDEGKQIVCNIHSGGLHQCDQLAIRYCLGAH
ncbi:MAG: GNAT family N-acetyltransferase [Candidatus Nanopelagicales bacterium]|jgi:ribosomal protein S18 acetylase RimI-like enzyme